jgi:hypothetical protein
MVTFYNHRGIRVTGEWISVDDRRYPIGELEDLRITRGPVHRAAGWAVGGSGSLLAMAIVLAPVVPGPVVVALAIAGIVAGAAALLVRMRPRELRLWGRFAGEWLPLAATRDDIELGKLTRALRRALERDARFQRMNRRSLLPAT